MDQSQIYTVVMWFVMWLLIDQSWQIMTMEILRETKAEVFFDIWYILSLFKQSNIYIYYIQ